MLKEKYFTMNEFKMTRKKQQEKPWSQKSGSVAKVEPEQNA